MTDQERIEKAMNHIRPGDLNFMCGDVTCGSKVCWNMGFTSGIHWRDKNPSEAVMKMRDEKFIFYNHGHTPIFISHEIIEDPSGLSAEMGETKSFIMPGNGIDVRLLGLSNEKPVNADSIYHVDGGDHHG